MLADLYGIPANRLQNKTNLLSVLRQALLHEGFHILRRSSFKFPGKHAGVTGVFLLSESHAAFHTYPEFEYMSLDIFSCGTADPAAVVHRVGTTLDVAEMDVSTRTRGRRAVPECGRRKTRRFRCYKRGSAGPLTYRL